MEIFGFSVFFLYLFDGDGEEEELLLTKGVWAGSVTFHQTLRTRSEAMPGRVRIKLLFSPATHLWVPVGSVGDIFLKGGIWDCDRNWGMKSFGGVFMRFLGI